MRRTLADRQTMQSATRGISAQTASVAASPAETGFGAVRAGCTPGSVCWRRCRTNVLGRLTGNPAALADIRDGDPITVAAGRNVDPLCSGGPGNQATTVRK